MRRLSTTASFTDTMRTSTAAFSSRLILLFILFSVANGAGDNITRSQPIRDGQTLVSAGGRFELGFFSPPGTSNRYVGIWFAVSKEAVVWVANRGNPLANSTGLLSIDAGGNLLLTDEANVTIWSTSGLSNAGNTVARLLDSGNLVLTDDDGSSSNGNGNGTTDAFFLWQSFDHPSDTLLPGMKLRLNLRTGVERSLTAGRSPSDPAAGSAVLRLDPRGMPQVFVWNQGSVRYRSGPWNGLRLSGVPGMRSYDLFNFTVGITGDEAYCKYDVTRPNIYARVQVLSATGVVHLFVLDVDANVGQNSWYTFWSAPMDDCDNYAYCGRYGVCEIREFPVCSCLPGFRPRNLDEWERRNGRGGCVRRTELNCSGGGDGFARVEQVKLPDTAVNTTVSRSMSLGECREVCLKSCSCRAYASANISGGGSGCVIWQGDLIDIRAYPSGGQDLYVRLAASEIDLLLPKSSKRSEVRIVVSVTIALGVLLLGLCLYCLWRRRRRKSMTMGWGTRRYYIDRSNSGEDTDIPLFDFEIIASATNDFSNANIIGIGGFGIVYKGYLGDGQVIAVKRLSSRSVNGVDGFKNEVMLIIKLQHRNLVRLLGCCIRGDEWMLIYEYMPNKSLDAFIFDDQKCLLLDWRKRLDIILGVARGLLYLHQDSRLRIIHRDLKAANILLDQDMNPKISDFGTARIFRRDQGEVTERVVGTCGYMSPEYAMDGVFSVKSDVFSFGVLTLEIITGRKNRWISPTDSNLNLLVHVWRLWKEDRCSDLLVDVLPYLCPFLEVSRFIQVGLLCVQGSPDDRPTMQEVVFMLVNENSTLPQPKEPGFFTLRDPMIVDSSSNSRHKSSSLNKLTVTNLHAR